MSEIKYRCSVGISYHTQTDSVVANAVIEALASIGVQALSLPYLTVSGYGISQPDNPDGMRKDGWVNHFLGILERSIGMIVLSTAGSVESEVTPWRGIWIERKLAQSYAQNHPEFILRLEHPSALHAAVTPKLEGLRRMIDELEDLKGSTGRKFDAAQGRIAYLEKSIAEYKAPLLPLPPSPPIPDPKDWARQILPLYKLG